MLSWQQADLETKGYPFRLRARSGGVRTQKMTAEIGVCPTLLSLSPIASRVRVCPRIYRARSTLDSSFVGPKSNGITKNDGISGEIYHLSNLRIGQEVEQACLLVAALELLYSFRKSEKSFLV